MEEMSNRECVRGGMQYCGGVWWRSGGGDCGGGGGGCCCCCFFFNDTATTEIYTLSLPRRSSDLPCLNKSSSIWSTTDSVAVNVSNFVSAEGSLQPIKIGRAHV